MALGKLKTTSQQNTCCPEVKILLEKEAVFGITELSSGEKIGHPLK